MRPLGCLGFMGSFSIPSFSCLPGLPGPSPLNNAKKLLEARSGRVN